MGIEAPEDRVEALLKELDGKDISEVVAGGLSKLASVPSGGGVSAGAAPAAGADFAHQSLLACFSWLPKIINVTFMVQCMSCTSGSLPSRHAPFIE